VVLVHGIGGIGKTTLLRRLQQNAGKSRRGGQLVANIVDCGDSAGAGSLPVDQLLIQLHAALQKGVVTDRHLKRPMKKAFKDFRTALAAQQKWWDRVSQLGISVLAGHDQLSAEQAEAFGQILSTVAKLGAPHAALPADAAVTMVGTVINMVRRRTDGPVSSAAYEALVANLDSLVSQFAQALRQLSRSAGPVVLFIDTAELLDDEALRRLRRAAKDSGSKVVWVLGLRLEAANKARNDSKAARFRADVHPARLRSMLLTSFDAPMVEEYLRRRLGALYPPDGLDTAAVTRRTYGVPLAVSLVGDRLADGEDLAAVLAPISDDGVSSVISNLVRQVLVHARSAPPPRRDLTLLYGLALRYGDVALSGSLGSAGGGWRDPGALAALWDVPVGEVDTCLESLEERHDFVLSGSGRLHQDVQEAVLLYLLDQRWRNQASELSSRAAPWYRARASQRAAATIDEQIDDQDWQSAMFSLLWHTFWIELGQGMQLLKALFTPVIIVNVSFAADLLRVADFFSPACTAADQRLIGDLHVVTSLQLTFRPSPQRRAQAADAARAVVQALNGCPMDPVLAPTPSAAVYYDLLQVTWHEALHLTATERAARLLRAAAGVEPGTATGREIAVRAGRLAIDAEEFRAAPAQAQETIISALQLVTFFGPDAAAAQHDLGNALFALGLLGEAETAYREAIRLNPREVMYRMNLGTMMVTLERRADADAAYREALQLIPSGAAACALLGNALYSKDQFRAAEAAYREAIRLNPGEAVYHHNLGNALYALDEDAEAAAAFREAIRLNPGEAVYHHNLGNALRALDEDAEAAASYREVLRLNPGSIEAIKDLGNALAAQNRYDEAEASYREALHLSPGDSEASIWLGYVLSGLGRFPEAEAAFRGAVRLDTGREAACTGLGHALMLLGRFEEAEASFREALRLDPSSAGAHYGLGYLYLLLPGRAAEAAAELRETLRSDPGSTNAHLLLGSFYVLTGESGAARSSYLQATQSRPVKEANAELMLGALERSTDPSAAAEHFTTALAILDHPHGNTPTRPFRRAELRALALAALGRDQEAATVLERAVAHRCAADVFQRHHYGLFATPDPPPGITALLEIWRTIIATDPAAAPYGALPLL
jgi:tetratricopeptide (TPR) repeat protein